MNARKLLIKQVLTPTFVTVADQPHELPGSVQRKRTRSPRQFEPGFFRRAVALTVIAAVAACHEILPAGSPAPRTRHHVIQRQLRTRENAPAELARIPVSQQNILA